MTTPGCDGVAPATAKQGATLDVTITGTDTNFVNGVSVASFSGTDIKVNSTSVSSPTTAVANITIAPGATFGARDVTVTTGTEIVTCPGAFTIEDASSENNITAFTIPSQVGTTTINEGARTIAVTMPYVTNVTALVPTITVSPAASVSPASGVAQNFTSPVIYTVTAEDTTTKTYTVTVTVAPNPAKAITAFTIPSQVGTTTINESADTIAVTMPYGTMLLILCQL